MPREEEIVLVNEPDISRDMWKLIKIKEIKKGKDGEARNAVIEMPHGRSLIRPINVLYPLEVDDVSNSRNQSQYSRNQYKKSDKRNPLPYELEMLPKDESNQKLNILIIAITFFLKISIFFGWKCRKNPIL